VEQEINKVRENRKARMKGTIITKGKVKEEGKKEKKE
jgi:hypothetical protein